MIRGRAGTIGGTALVACLIAVLTLTVAPAAAKTIHVRAKKEDAVAKALDRADPGDRLVLHRGTYDDPVVVDKRVRIVGRKKGRKGHKGRKPVLDFACSVHTGLDVLAEGVKLRRLKLRGAFHFTVDIDGIEQATVQQVRLIDDCDAEYGINVFQAGAIQLIDNRASGYDDAAIYVGAITDTGGGTFLIEGNEVFDNQYGILVEESAGGDIRVISNHAHDNDRNVVGTPAGIYIHVSDDVLIEDNLSEGNGLGIFLNPGSDDNRVFDNVFRSNDDNVLDQGNGNCGSGNTPSGEFDPC